LAFSTINIAMHFGRYLLVTGELSCTSLLDIICTHERNGAYGKTGVIQKRHLGGGFSMYNNCIEPSYYNDAKSIDQ
jgi:hypothetical protein